MHPVGGQRTGQAGKDEYMRSGHDNGNTQRVAVLGDLHDDVHHRSAREVSSLVTTNALKLVVVGRLQRPEDWTYTTKIKAS